LKKTAGKKWWKNVWTKIKFHCMHNNLRILPEKRDLSY
jgi:hypothetical protein